MRELNEGVSRIYREMSDLFLEDPIYIEDKGSSLKLVLKNNIVMRSKRKNELLLKDNNINKKWKELNSIEQKTIQFIFDKGDVMTHQIAEYIDRDRKTAQRILKKLENKELIEWAGTSNKDPKNNIFKNIAKMLCSFYLPINVYILLSSGIISVGDT